MSMKTVKRLAAGITGVGYSRLRFNKDKLEDISKALTRDDVRALLKFNHIMILAAKKVKSTVGKLRAAKRTAGRRRGYSKRRGTKAVRSNKRESWHNTLRVQRAYLRQLLKAGTIDKTSFRRLYLLSKGNMFKGKKSIMMYIDVHEMKKKQE